MRTCAGGARDAIAKAHGHAGEGEGRDTCPKESEERDFACVMDATFREVEAVHTCRKRWLYVGMPLPNGHQRKPVMRMVLGE